MSIAGLLDLLPLMRLGVLMEEVKRAADTAPVGAEELWVVLGG